jgi:hypothetical protein
MSTHTVTVFPSQPEGGPRDAIVTVQTGASIAGAEVVGHADEGLRPRRRTMVAVAVFAGFGVIAAVLALSLGPAAHPESAASSGIVQGTPATSATPVTPEEKAPAVDLGAPGAATLPAPPEGQSAGGEPGGVANPLASAEPAKSPVEGRKKASPAVAGASTSSGKPPAKNRPRPPPTAEPGRDLMEP